MSVPQVGLASSIGPTEQNSQTACDEDALAGVRLQELYREHSPSLVRQLARGTGCREVARDLVQETFLALLRMAPGSLARIKQPESYLRRVPTNLLRTRRKKEAFREEALSLVVAAIHRHCQG